MRNLRILTGLAVLVGAAVPCLAQNTTNNGSTTPPGTVTQGGASSPTPGSTGAAMPVPPPPGAAIDDQVKYIQAEIDALKAARGGETDWISYEIALQKQLDALKAAIAAAGAKAATPGYGKLTFAGLAQVWAMAGTHPENGVDGNGVKYPSPSYLRMSGFAERLRRIEININDQIDKNVLVHTMFDPSRTASTATGSNGILQELDVQYTIAPGQDLFFGQMKLPLTEVGTESSAHLATIERPLFVMAAPRNIAGSTTPIPLWGDIRDIGLQYRLARPKYSAQLALTEGVGDYQNVIDNKYGKQFTGQIFVRPLGANSVQFGVTGSTGAGLQTAAFSAVGSGATATPGAAPYLLKRDRIGGSVVWKPGRWLLQTEYMSGVDGTVAPGKSGIAAIAANPTATPPVVGSPAVPGVPPLPVNLNRHGEYGLVGYDLGGYKQGDGYQVVAMEDYFDPGGGLLRQQNTTVGINHDMDGGHRRLQFNVIDQHFDGAGAPSDILQAIIAAGINF